MSTRLAAACTALSTSSATAYEVSLYPMSRIPRTKASPTWMIQGPAASSFLISSSCACRPSDGILVSEATFVLMTVSFSVGRMLLTRQGRLHLLRGGFRLQRLRVTASSTQVPFGNVLRSYVRSDMILN